MARRYKGRGRSGGAIVGARSKAAGRIDSVMGRQLPRKVKGRKA